MTFRYLLVSLTGEITGTNDEDSLPDVDSSLDIATIIDTKNGTYTDEENDAAVIAEYEPDSDD